MSKYLRRRGCDTDWDKATGSPARNGKLHTRNRSDCSAAYWPDAPRHNGTKHRGKVADVTPPTLLPPPLRAKLITS